MPPGRAQVPRAPGVLVTGRPVAARGPFGRRAAFRPVSLDRHEPVADVAHGADQRLVLGAELGPQPPDVDVDRAGAAEVVVAPDLLQQLRPGEDPARVLGEELEQLELLEGEVERRGRGAGRCRWPRRWPARRSGSRPAPRSTAATARRPMASRSLASTSAGPAVFRITSSMPQSAFTAARPPSVTIANSGQSRPVVRSSRQMLLACARSRRASTRTASAGGASTSADASAGQDADRVQQQARAGSTSADGSSTLVISSRSLTRRHLHSLVR